MGMQRLMPVAEARRLMDERDLVYVMISLVEGNGMEEMWIDHDAAVEMLRYLPDTTMIWVTDDEEESSLYLGKES